MQKLSALYGTEVGLEYIKPLAKVFIKHKGKSSWFLAFQFIECSLGWKELDEKSLFSFFKVSPVTLFAANTSQSTKITTGNSLTFQI